MKKKLLTLAFGLLLAVGWNNVATAQLKAEDPSLLKNLTEFSNMGPVDVGNVKSGVHQSKMDGPKIVKNDVGRLKAPARTPNTITADVTHTYDWYDAITYDWVDANGNPQNSRITEPATTAEQMAYLLGTTYMNPNIPGIQYTEGWQTIHPYSNIGYGWDIPTNSRWPRASGIEATYNDIVISYATNSYIRIYSIQVKSGNEVITSYCYATDGSTLPSGDGWSWGISGSWNTSGNYIYPSSGASITIPGSLLTGYTDVSLVINCYDSSTYYYAYISVNGTSTQVGADDPTDYTWTIDSNNGNTSVTPPYENGYTVFLVKVKDDAVKEPYWVYSWSELIDYFDTHIDEVQLLTDGTRLNEGTDDAGTMFSYSGELNRFYFASKGKMFYLSSSTSTNSNDCAPTNMMYEEFSAHTAGESSPDITDFYSMLLYGNSYNIVHDCQGVNALEHYFSMSGKNGTEHRSMTNLIFWIPDNRGVAGTRNYNEEYLPHVGLYTITLEATAVPSNTEEHKYVVTCEWVSSLNSILDFPVSQDYEVYEYVYDEQGNPVKKRLVGTTHDTTYTFETVDQWPESYTIVYRVHGWPSAATNTPGHYPNDPVKGNFFALSNLDPVLIPGYNDFLSLGVEHYESDFALNQEYNYYRNFLTVDNQNPDKALTPQRIQDGDGAFELYRYDATDLLNPKDYVKAADLTFTVEDNKVKYLIEYANQFYVDDANIYNAYNDDNLKGYTDPNTLGCQTSGTIANISEGGGETPTEEPVGDIRITFASGNADFKSITVAGNKGTTSWSFAQYGTSLPQGWSTTTSFTEDPGDCCYMPQGGTITVPATLLNGSTTVTVTINAKTYDSQYNSCAVTVHGAQTETITITDYSNWNDYTWTVDASSASTSTTDVTFTAGTDVAQAKTITKDGVTITNTQSQANNNSFSYDPYRFYTGTLSFTAPQGSTITSIVFNVSSGYSTTSINGTGYSSGIWTGDASSVSLNVTSQVRCSSIVVTVKTQGSGSDGSFVLLNNFLDNSTYTQVGQVVFQLPWKSIQVKLQDSSAGSSSGYFLIQSDGKLRFIMPAGYNNANLKFVIRNAALSSNYHDGTFTLSSSTGDTETITFATTEGNVERSCIFEHISSGDVITITGTHDVVNDDNTISHYNYSPDFKYIRVYVQGGNEGISMNTALNLDAVKFVDQFKAETKNDTHPYRYGYVLRQGTQESGQPKVPVQHTNSTVHGFYSLNEINGDTLAPLFDKNVMNGEVNMTLSREPEIYYYTLDRKPSNVNNALWEAVSKLQKNEDDSYREMFTFLPQYEDQICNPPTLNTTPWIVDRYDNYDIKTGGYNSYMSYVPIIWTHGDQKNRRVKWDTEHRHNSYGAPIWKTGVAEVTLKSATAERQDAPSTSWTYGGEDCNLYMLNNVLAEAKMPTVNNVKYVPYMFRIFVKSNSDKLRGYKYVPAGVDPDKPGQHYDGDVINDTKLKCVWSGYMNDPRNIPAEGAQYGPNGVSVSYDPATGICTFNKIKVDPTETGGDWDPNSKDNAIFAGLTDIITEENGVKSIDPEDLTIVVRFYYIVEGFDASMPGRGEGDDPAGYGVEGSGDPEAWTAISDVIYNADVESVTYVNTLGMTSDKPFDGMNIVITRYSNGMTTTRKVVR